MKEKIFNLILSAIIFIAGSVWLGRINMQIYLAVMLLMWANNIANKNR